MPVDNDVYNREGEGWWEEDNSLNILHGSITPGRFAYFREVGDGNAPAAEVNLFRHTYNTLRPHQALDERTPRAVYLAVEHGD
jgi:hypothetical protein